MLPVLLFPTFGPYRNGRASSVFQLINGSPRPQDRQLMQRGEILSTSLPLILLLGLFCACGMSGGAELHVRKGSNR
jgi:hypothetical protein